jgi:UDPglucose 6-dehydrogenase
MGIAQGQGDAGKDALDEAYAPITSVDNTPIVVTDFATAELVKVAANSFLATKISFINAMAEVCEATGADVTLLAKAIGYDVRIGHRFLHAGLGFGGGCLPKDIRAFIARAGELGVDQAVAFLKNVDEINLRRRARMVDLAREVCDGSLAGRRVGVLGVAFKPNSDDIRDSPALDVALSVQRAGAAVRVYDPEAMKNAEVMHPMLAYSPTAAEACYQADVVLHLTEWEEFRDLEPDALKAVVAEPRIVDGRNALDPDKWIGAGWHFRALGRPYR